MKQIRRTALIVSLAVAIALAWIFVPRHFRSAPGPAEPGTPASAGDKLPSALPKNMPSTTRQAMPSATPSHPEGPNAADIYKNAFMLYKALTDEEKLMLAKPREEVDADKADALFKKIQPIMELLRKAKDATYCDWGMGPVSFTTPLPQLNLVMKLGQTAQWSSGYQFLSSNPDAAISDLATQSALEHSIGAEALIGFLVVATLNQGAINLVRDNAAALSPEGMTQALDMFRSSTWNHDFQLAVKTEASWLSEIADQLSNPKIDDPTLKNMKMVSGNDVALIQSQIQWVQQMERDFASKAALSDTEFNAWWTQVTRQAASQPLAVTLLPNLSSIRTRYQSAAVNNSMIVAGLSILQNGPTQLNSQPDPTTGRPFTYVETANGFELRSTFQSKGKPVTMTFTYPAK